MRYDVEFVEMLDNITPKEEAVLYLNDEAYSMSEENGATPFQKNFSTTNSAFHQMAQGIIFHELAKTLGIQNVISEISLKKLDDKTFDKAYTPDIVVMQNGSVRCAIEIELGYTSSNTNTKIKEIKRKYPDLLVYLVNIFNKENDPVVITPKNGVEDKIIRKALDDTIPTIKAIDTKIFTRS